MSDLTSDFGVTHRTSGATNWGVPKHEPALTAELNGYKDILATNKKKNYFFFGSIT